MTLRSWSFIHKWTSLICTIFLLLLCITGLPLIFHEEIEHLSGEAEAPEMAADIPELSMDQLVAAAQAHIPAKVVRYMIWDAEEHPHITLVNMSTSMDAPPDDMWLVALDSRTGKVLDERAAQRPCIARHVGGRRAGRRSARLRAAECDDEHERAHVREL